MVKSYFHLGSNLSPRLYRVPGLVPAPPGPSLSSVHLRRSRWLCTQDDHAQVIHNLLSPCWIFKEDQREKEPGRDGAGSPGCARDEEIEDRNHLRRAGSLGLCPGIT